MKSRPNISDLEKKLGYFFSNSSLLNLALTHKSFSSKNNERLEFLGDAVLSLVVAELLFLEHPKKEEGFLSKRRSVIVARKHLNLVGRAIIPEKEIKSRLNPLPENVFGNILEALIGAIYIDKGLDDARIFIKKNIYDSIFLPSLLGLDYKSRLLRISQKEGVKTQYLVEKKEVLDHQKKFLASVLINDKKTAEGSGSTKKEAEQAAAKNALKNVFLPNEKKL